MFVEDLIYTLSICSLRVNPYDKKVIDSFSAQIVMGTGFTEKQSSLALKLLQKNIGVLSHHLKIDVRDHVENPKYRLAIRKTIIDKTIRLIENNSKRAIELKFPYDENLITKIKTFKSDGGEAVWDKDRTAWIFNFSEKSLGFLLNIFEEFQLTYDADIQNYFDEFKKIIDNLENHAPMLSMVDGNPKIVNSSKYMPEISTNDLLEAIFEARKIGITLWDDHFEKHISEDNFNPTLKTFIKNGITNPVYLDPKNDGIFCLKQIVKYLSPCLFILPGGSELEKMSQAYTYLHEEDIDDKNMSVLFRLPTETGRNFNDFVKNHGINGPINEETKIVFVSSKLPKTVIKAGLKFNSVINFGFDNAHYTLKEFVKNHQNLVYFDVKNTNRSHVFA